ncbi:zinc-finger homeodomain protein 2-like [Henckelia pumila]|uniref:zinc-finger homeodomain protein 2-like n=1 Tax=Henckelia pumila TaxID=405737 RepID=UPI003C6E0B90
MALNGGGGKDDKDMRIQSSSLGFDESPPEQERTRIVEPSGGGGSKSKLLTSPRISYRECLRNHAANMGGNVTDGCGEFMPNGGEGTLEALMCAACSCHRNFHRKEHGVGAAGMVQYPALHLPPPLLSPLMSHHRVGSSHWSPMVQTVKMAGGGGGGGGGTSVGTDSSSEELNFNSLQVAPAPPPKQHFVSRKRFRTKFTAEQKEKMMEFAEKVGWRIPREDDSEMQRFCGEVGVQRQVFKVWMHNNKINSSKLKISQDI